MSGKVVAKNRDFEKTTRVLQHFCDFGRWRSFPCSPYVNAGRQCCNDAQLRGCFFDVWKTFYFYKTPEFMTNRRKFCIQVITQRHLEISKFEVTLKIKNSNRKEGKYSFEDKFSK